MSDLLDTIYGILDSHQKKKGCDSVELTEFYDLAEEEQIPVITYPMKENGSMSLMDSQGNCYIGMDPHILDGGLQETTHLAHELGHCMTGSFYNCYATIDHRKKHENQADKWAIEKLIPVEALDDAIASGHTEIWELADYFGVHEDLMRKAICYYVHGNLAAELYF